MKITANGKINLTLDILGKRDDGYHEVEMIMQAIDLHDVIMVEKNDSCDIILDCKVDGVEDDKDNLIYKAAQLFLKAYDVNCGVNISLQKNIPIAAGLAGGSADAAAVLRGLNDLFALNKSDDDLCELGGQLGSDIPFCIKGGTMLATGRGEKIAAVDAMPDCAFVVVKPKIGVSTAWVYNNYKAEIVEQHPATKSMLAALCNKSLDTICKTLDNVLESVTINRYPQLQEYKQMLCTYGAKAALMSGSGPSVFAVCDDKKKAEDVAQKFAAKYKDLSVYVTSPVNENKGR